MLKKPLANNQIRSKEVRLIDEEGKQVGIVNLEEALSKARERSLDLIQVTEKVEPPVCRIGDYGKYLYKEEKKGRATQKHKGGETKGIRLSFNISPHDLETRARQAEKFLNKGNRVIIELRLKGREKALQGVAIEKVEKFMEIIRGSISVKIERELKREFRGLTMIISKSHAQT